MAGTYDFKAHVSGNTFGGKTFTIDREGLELESVRMELTVGPTKVLKHVLSSENGMITIVNAQERKFQIDEQILSFSANTYHYTIKCVYTDGTVKTDIKGVWPFEYYGK